MFTEIRRLRQILTTFARFGLFLYLQKLPRLRKFIPKKIKEEMSLPEGLRIAFESLGPTFIKIGQLLSCRVDLFPKDVINSLSKLQDRVEPTKFEKMETTLKNELGGRYKLVENINKIPIASASLSQVYRGRVLRENVVFKIKRPGTDKIVQTDFRILYQIARMVENNIKEVSWVKPTEFVQELRKNVLMETDFRKEVRNILEFRKKMNDENGILIPEVMDEFTTGNLIVMKEISGKRLYEIKDKAKRKEIAKRGSDFILKQIFKMRIFHADPHPGNILITPQDEIAFLDFGLVGRLDSVTTDILKGVILAIMERDTFYLYKLLKDIGIIGEEQTISKIENQMKSLIDEYIDKPMQDIDTREIISQTTTMLRRLHITMPTNLLLLAKTLSQLEGVARMLDPDFVLAGYLKPYLKSIYMETFFPHDIGKITIKALRRMRDSASSIPRIIYYIQDWLDKGKLRLKIEKQEDIIKSIEGASTRISIGIITASIIIGSAFIIRGPKRLIPFGIFGFILAGIFGIWFLYRLIRYKEF